MGNVRGLGPELVIAERRPVLRGNLFFFGHGVCAEGTSFTPDRGHLSALQGRGKARKERSVTAGSCCL